MNKISKFFIFILLLSIIFLPALSLAQEGEWQGLVKCGKADENGQIKECGFSDLVILFNDVVEFIFIKLVVPIAAIMFFYAGFLMITAGEEAAGSRTKAKNIFKNAVLGLVIAAAAWLIINTLLSILGYDGSWIGFEDNV